MLYVLFLHFGDVNDHLVPFLNPCGFFHEELRSFAFRETLIEC